MPTREAYAVAALALLIFFVAFNLQAGWVYAVDALLVGLLAAGFVSARLAMRGLTVRRAMPGEVFEGEPVRVTLTLRAAGRLAPRFFLEVTDAVPGLEPACEFVPVLTPGRAERVTYASPAVRRGVHDVSSATARSAGLTGLFAAYRQVQAPGGITVYPRYWKISRFPMLGWAPAPETSGSARQRGGLEFYGLRDYRHGDSLRHVHWRSTARRGAPVVREFEQENPGSVTLLLDTRPLSKHRAGSVGAGEAEQTAIASREAAKQSRFLSRRGLRRPRGPHNDSGDGAFEDLVRAAASIAWFVTTNGGTIRLLLARGERTLDVRGGWRDVLQVLAKVEPDGLLSPASIYAGSAQWREASLVVLARDADAVLGLVRRGARPAAILAERPGPPPASTRAGEAAESLRAPQGRSNPLQARRGLLRSYAPRNDGEPSRTDGEVPRNHGEVLLRGLGIPVCVLRSGDDIGERLERSG